MRATTFSIWAALLIAWVVIAGTMYTVNPRDQALIKRFGEVQRVVTEPGFHWKTFFTEDVTYYPKRILALDVNPIEVLTLEQERLIVDAISRYRITDLQKFYTDAKSRAGAESRLSTYIQSALREKVAGESYEAVIREKRDEMMDGIWKQVRANAKRELGIEVIDVRIKRVDLPQQNSARIFEQMNSERNKESVQIRAEGDKLAREITSTAEKDAKNIRTGADARAQAIRGDGDAQALKIKTTAFNEDIELFSLRKQLDACLDAVKASDVKPTIYVTSFMALVDNCRS